MIYTAEILSPKKNVWGKTHSKDFILPNRISIIKGFFANAILGKKSTLKSNSLVTYNCAVTDTLVLLIQKGKYDIYSQYTIFEPNNLLGSDYKVYKTEGDFFYVRKGEYRIYKKGEFFWRKNPNDFEIINSTTLTPQTIQLGNFSVSLNNTDIIADNAPLLAISESPNQTFTDNYIELSTPKKVAGGSLMRVIVNEPLISPFDVQSESNDYRIKIYLNYD